MFNLVQDIIAFFCNPQRRIIMDDETDDHEGNNIIMEDQEGTSIMDLPLPCISIILSFTSAKDACRSSAVSKLFYEAASSHIVWSKFFPEAHRISRCISAAATTMNDSSSPMPLYSFLSKGTFLDNETKFVKIDQSTGKMRIMLRPRKDWITWGADPRYWNWVRRPDAMFGEVAVLGAVCWMEIIGTINCGLLSANTMYKISFLVNFDKKCSGWESTVIKLLTKLPPNGEEDSWTFPLSNPVDVATNPNFRERDSKGWIYLRAGHEFLVHPEWVSNNLDIRFEMWEINSGWWKSGLIVAGYCIEPVH